MRRWFVLVGVLEMALSLAGCENQHDDMQNLADLPDNPIVIVYENDVHCAVDGYAKMVSLREKQQRLTPYVTTVSCGDFIQGDVVGAVTEGESIIDIMNKVKYDVVTLGNHEFDYGLPRLYELAERLQASLVCANFRNLTSGESVFPPYEIIRYGDVDIAYLGLVTPETLTSTTPLTFQDKAGNTIYGFCKEQFYTIVQQHVDAARKEGADYVVVLSHLGDLPSSGGSPNSLALIANTTGIDAVLDGHSHSVIPDTLVENGVGEPVLLSSTGTKFQYVGMLTITTDGTLESRLIPIDDTLPADVEVETYVEQVKKNTLTAGERVVGYNEKELVAIAEDGSRLVRKQETGLGNFCADAYRRVLDVDVAVVNGGGIRANLPQGDVTYNSLLAVSPFNNTLCTATLTGRQLVDALEVSVCSLPEEDGSFMQVSGIRFEVDTSVPTPVVMNTSGLFDYVVAGAPRRVHNVQVLDSDTKVYVPIDLERTYTLGSYDYLLKEQGSYNMFGQSVLKIDMQGQDAEILAVYIERMLGGRISAIYSQPEGRIIIK